VPVLVDSDVLIEVARGRDAEIIEKWQRLSDFDGFILCSPVTVAELWHGAKPSEHRQLEALFSSLLCVPIDQEVGRVAGDYLKRYAKSHSLELGDALIAASASTHKAELWTRNRKHYPMPELRFF
jgi:predicted nucleic acid-binding protein